jgi:hypothetical protein
MHDPFTYGRFLEGYFRICCTILWISVFGYRLANPRGDLTDLIHDRLVCWFACLSGRQNNCSILVVKSITSYSILDFEPENPKHKSFSRNAEFIISNNRL